MDSHCPKPLVEAFPAQVMSAGELEEV